MTEVSEQKLDVLETLQPSVGSVEYEIAGETYTQRPLSFFGKLELFSILGSALDKALRDVSVTEIFDVSDVKANEFSDAEEIIKAVSKLVQYAPDFLKDLYCVALSVPRDEREDFKIVLETISEEDGFKIIDVFIEQNGQALLDFFSERILPLVDKASGLLQSGSAPSKPPKRSRQSTAKQ